MFTSQVDQNYDQTTEELARCWRDSNKELASALGCKVYIIDARKHNYKKDLYLHFQSSEATMQKRNVVLWSDPELS